MLLSKAKSQSGAQTIITKAPVSLQIVAINYTIVDLFNQDYPIQI